MLLKQLLQYKVSNFFYVFLGQYFGACVIIMTLSTIFTIIVLRSHHNSSYDHDVPPLIKTVVFGFLAKVVFMSSAVKVQDYVS